MAMATLAEDEVSVLPRASCTATCTAGAIKAPAAVLPGCTRNANFVAVPTVMSKATEVAPARPAEEATRV